MPSQEAIRNWFDTTYAEKGLSYLRPAEFYTIFLELMNVTPGRRLLDIGCGPGLLLGEARRRQLLCWGIDISETALRMIRGGGADAGAAACNSQSLCFHRHCFDYITCIGVFEHFLSPRKALAEMRRVLRLEGILCMLVPNSSSLRWKLNSDLLGRYDEDSHERAATLDDWTRTFARGGWRVDRVIRDPWTLHRFRQILPGLSRKPFSSCLSRTRHLLPLRYASQFIFLLKPERD